MLLRDLALELLAEMELLPLRQIRPPHPPPIHLILNQQSDMADETAARLAGSSRSNQGV
jgi:hypothetical protein